MINKNSKLNILVLGYIVRGPLGGLAWHHLQYFLGLTDLGHNVVFLEDSDDYPSCYDPSRQIVDTNPEYGLNFISKTFNRIGHPESWAYYDMHSSTWHGPASARISNICLEADVLINLSGINPIRDWFSEVPIRIFLDTDPVFTQINNLEDVKSKQLADQHNQFFSFGENIGSENCMVPDDGYPWISTRQPIYLDAWPVSIAPINGHYTTVMQWDSYAQREYGGMHFGMKSLSFENFIDLPKYTPKGTTLELALGSDTAPRSLLQQNGWLLQDPLKVTKDPWVYQNYIQKSKAEFSIAKHGYVVSKSGWFSERSAAYLASGRPVIVQETGFRDWLQTEEGVLSFNDPEEALNCIEDVNSNYAKHCRVAREIVESHFASKKVLDNLLETAFSNLN